MFFFEKKNQKTFIPWHCALLMEESLFASFSTEKEDSVFVSGQT